MSRKCLCFPQYPKFRNQYTELLKNEPYLAEKTMPTMERWLVGKTVTNYDLVPFYAQSDYEEYLARDMNPHMMTMVKMSAGMNTNKIKDALDSMANPCDCLPR